MKIEQGFLSCHILIEIRLHHPFKKVAVILLLKLVKLDFFNSAYLLRDNISFYYVVKPNIYMLLKLMLVSYFRMRTDHFSRWMRLESYYKVFMIYSSSYIKEKNM